MTEATLKKSMKSSTMFGLILGFVAIFGAFLWEGGSIKALFMLPAMLIVFGGTMAAGIAGTSLKLVLNMPKLIKIAFFPPKYDEQEITDQIVEFATIARRHGFLAIEGRLAEIEHPFLHKLFQICVDGAEPEDLQKIADIEIHFITERHNSNIRLFVKLGGYSPTMGIIGTVMGLISTLAAAGNEPTILIQHIATAFIATMWGIFMANIVWLPLGDKLRTLHSHEMQLLQIMLEGVHSVQIGELPSIIRAKLVSAFPLSEQLELIEKQKKYHTSFTEEPKIYEEKPENFDFSHS